MESPEPSSPGQPRLIDHAAAARVAPYALIGLWTVVVIARALSGHASLESGAFDLGVFDRAIHDLPRSGRGFVSFLGASVFSEDFSPILYLLAPLHAMWPSATLLVVLQPVVLGASAVVFYHLARRIGTGLFPALALALTFLLARRTHSAFSGYFHPETFQVGLTFAMVWCSTRAWPAYGLVVLLLLSTHEAASVSVGAFGLFLATFGPVELRRRGLVTAAAGALWFFYAVGLAVPSSRIVDGLPPASTVVSEPATDRASAAGFGGRVGRIVSLPSAATTGELLLTAGALPLAAGAWLLPAVPGVLLGLSAPADSLQGAFVGHYVSNVLPWLFVAAAAGFVWIRDRAPAVALAWVGVLLAGTIVDNPALRRLPEIGPDRVAGNVRSQLASVSGTIVLAQANLVPHLPYAAQVFVIGRGAPPRPPDLVLLTRVGDTWPLTAPEVAALIEEYRRDPRYRLAVSGPLYAFVRRE